MMIRIFFLSLLPLLSFGKCYYVPCYQNIIQGQTKAEATINSGFTAIENNLSELIRELKKQDALGEKENEMLKEYAGILANKIKQEKEIIFLMEKYNKLLANKISERSLSE